MVLGPGRGTWGVEAGVHVRGVATIHLLGVLAERLLGSVAASVSSSVAVTATASTAPTASPALIRLLKVLGRRMDWILRWLLALGRQLLVV